MAAADTKLAQYYEDVNADRNQVNPISGKADISDSAGSNNHLSEDGDKVYIDRVPKYAVFLFFWLTQKGLDTNAAATQKLKVIADDGTTQHELIPSTTVLDGGVHQELRLDGDFKGDVLDGGTKANIDIYVEADGAQATAGTSGCEIAWGGGYHYNPAHTDPD